MFGVAWHEINNIYVQGHLHISRSLSFTDATLLKKKNSVILGSLKL